MKQREYLFPASAARISLILLLGAWGALCAFSQNQVPLGQAISLNQSRAEQEADELVSLSPEKIISLLQAEPGLLLQVKKALVRKAYEQGRLLDPQDLTDEALFRLVREDFNIRVLITRQIEDRYYVHAKPSREELERGEVVPTQEAEKPATENAPVKPSNEEDAYWSKHEQTFGRYPSVYGNNPSPAAPAASNNVQPQFPGQPAPYNPGWSQPNSPVQPTPGNQSSPDVRRQLEMTQAQPPEGDYPDSLPPSAAQMPRVQPEELPALLSASSTSAGSSYPGGNPMAPDRNGPSPYSGPGTLFSPPPSAEGNGLAPENSSPYPMEARATVPWQPYPSPNQPEWRPGETILRHRADPYADVPSLYDLYSQYANRPGPLERFGVEIFRNGTGNFNQLPMDVPAGPEYVLGPGDGLNIELWGGVSERLVRVVDRQGRVALPEVGAVEVAGHSLGEVQRLVQKQLQTQFRDVQADVSLSRLRAVRVYVVGDVERPGAYDVSSLSTPLNAVYLAGGPTSRGSLRTIEHYRGKQLLQTVDVYDLLLHGVHSDLEGLQPGDTILVPPLGPEITIEGMVRRPAIYELNGERSLSQVLELAGGVLQTGTLRHVDVERTQAHLSRTMLRLDIPENNNQEAVNKALDDFQIQDGDKIKISPILPYADKTVYLEGHVFRPGKFAYRDGMKVTDLIHSYNDLLPEPYKRHAEIIRLEPPDYRPVVLAFNLGDALAGKDQNLVLRPFDTVRVFGRFDFQDPPVITINGAVRDPGDHLSNGATRLSDAVYLAGGVTPDAELNDAQVFRHTEDGKLKVLSVNLDKALADDPADNILLQPKDRVFIHHSQAKLDPPTVMIQGEVARPGKYPLGEDMTAADLVRVAGGFKRGAYTDTADLTRYEVENGSNVAGEHMTVEIAKAMASEPDTDVRLHDGDVLTIRQMAGWNDIGATITVSGEVLHPGTYGIKEGERLSSIIERAGGLRSDAYPFGAVFERRQVQEMEQQNRSSLLQEVQGEGASLKLIQDTDEDEKVAKNAALMQWQSTVEKLQSTPPAGRLVIHISAKMKRWVGTSSDITVRDGDSLYIPKRPNLVMVDGSVYNPTAVTFKPGKDAGWYLRQAGGPTNMANKKAIFVIRADGSVAGGSGGLFTGGVEKAALQPGDMVMVPEKAYSGNTRWKNTLQSAQLAYAVGIAIQVARSF
jgi:protein involved in polysaccharide export with SLBB domain